MRNLLWYLRVGVRGSLLRVYLLLEDFLDTIFFKLKHSLKRSLSFISSLPRPLNPR